VLAELLKRGIEQFPKDLKLYGDDFAEQCRVIATAAMKSTENFQEKVLFGSIFQVSGEALPGQGVRRAGSDITEGSLTIAAGRRLRALDLMLARAAGLKKLA
jgi:molybdopterin biosynthesis enzyme